ncbi:Interferon-related developmental regulator [Carpediemonas membranifera]|uniref:Interferon-related developmental regulator n=1 Tax=Carpediemonas membranifera TaxID=201153 RepID=A0A8J6E338_9EUKA|nr:Interferon-related developmental regulator [Carpediemonas membranifera]|eukprot:KAG9395438.1 Interferon-related developmental regulator [Carpediemonas membranifera]
MDSDFASQVRKTEWDPNWVELIGEKAPLAARQGFAGLIKFLRDNTNALEDVGRYIETISMYTAQNLRSKKPLPEALLFISVAVITLAEEASVLVVECLDSIKRLCTSKQPNLRVNAYHCLGAVAFAVLEEDQAFDSLDLLAEHAFGSKGFQATDMAVGRKAHPGYIMACLDSISLIVTSLRPSLATKFADSKAASILKYLEHGDVGVRIHTGQLLGILVQSTKSSGLKERKPMMLELIDELAEGSAKSLSKDDKKVQRATFRDLAATLTGNGPVQVKTLTVVKHMGVDGEGHQVANTVAAMKLELRTWAAIMRYDTISKLLGEGLLSHVHTQESPVHAMLDVDRCNIAGTAGESKASRLSEVERGRGLKADVRAAAMDGTLL